MAIREKCHIRASMTLLLPSLPRAFPTTWIYCYSTNKKGGTRSKVVSTYAEVNTQDPVSFQPTPWGTKPQHKRKYKEGGGGAAGKQQHMEKGILL